MGKLSEVSKNLLLISQGNVSIYERATSSFEERTRPIGFVSGTRSVPQGPNAGQTPIAPIGRHRD
jgi:hypothetical protein